MRISIVILDAEIKKNRLLALQAENEWKEIEAIYKDPGGQIYPPYRNEKLSRIKNEKPKNDLLFYKNYLRELNDSLSTLDSIKKSMDWFILDFDKTLGKTLYTSLVSGLSFHKQFT